jgi:YHS domain-containing protein
MKSYGIITFALSVFTAASLFAGNPQTRCPVSGDQINKQVFVDHQGQRIYFCHPGCIDEFKADPATYLAKLAKEGIELEKTPVPQTLCPVLGGQIDKQVFVDYGGKRVYFCCQNCLDKFKTDPKGYIKKMEDKGITLEKTPAAETKPAGHGESTPHKHQHDH